jgi:hypothetical protein
MKHIKLEDLTNEELEAAMRAAPLAVFVIEPEQPKTPESEAGHA